MNVGIDSYTLKMIEQMTAPLRKIQEQMERTSSGMEKLQKLALTAFAGGAVVVGIKLIGGAIGGLISMMSAGVGVAQRFMGTVLEAAKFRTQNIGALEVLLGKGKGEQYFKGALRVGGIAPADERDVVEQVRKLAAAGWSGGGLNRANAALLDVQSIMGKESSDSLSYYLQKFKGGLSVERDDLRMAASSAGLKERDILGSMIGLAGGSTKGLNDYQLGKQVEKLKKAGKLNGEVAAEAMLQAIKAKLDNGGKLGDVSKKMGMGTLTGLLSNLEAAPMRFLSEMRLEKLPGIKIFMEFIQRLLPFFDHGTVQGKQLAKVVKDITGALFGGFKNITGDTLARFFAAGVKVAKDLVEVVKQAWKFIDAMINGNLFDVIGSGAKLLFYEMGKLIGRGIWEGLWASNGRTDKPTDSRGPGGPAPLTGQGAGASARAGFGEALGKVAGTGGKLVQGFGEALTGVGGTASKVGGGLSEAFGKAGKDFARALGIGKTEVKIENLNVGAAVTPAQARDTASTLTEAVRNSNARTGAAPAGAP